MFFGDWLQRREMLSPNKVALIDAVPSTEFIPSKVEGLRTGNDNQPITYREWNQRANQFANFFRDGPGLHKGDRVSICAGNRVEYLDALFACNKLGAILHVVTWRLTVRELEGIINDAAPRALLYTQEFRGQVDALRPRLPTVKHFVGLDGSTARPGSRQRAKELAEVQVTSDQAPKERCADLHWPTERSNWPKTQPPPVELDWEDPWVICYTGGTTGLPKGAILHYRSMIANSVNTIVSWGLRPDDVIPQYMPFFHTGGLNVLTTLLVHLGGTSIVCAGFDIDQLFDQVAKLGVTFFFAVPTMFLSMIQHPRWESLNLSNVRLVMAGGGACPAVVYEAFWEKGVEFKVGYGLTEAGPNTFWLPTAYMKSKIGSVGRPLFHIDVKLVDEFGEEVSPDEVGRAIVVLRPGTSLSQSDLIDWLREKMAHYKVPKSIAFVDSLPKTAANKVDKQALIEQHGS